MEEPSAEVVAELRPTWYFSGCQKPQGIGPDEMGPGTISHRFLLSVDFLPFRIREEAREGRGMLQRKDSRIPCMG